MKLSLLSRAAALGFFLAVQVSSPALAQTIGTPGPDEANMAAMAAKAASSPPPSGGQQAVDKDSFLKGLQAALQMSSTASAEDPAAKAKAQAEEEERALYIGSATDPNSPLYKANKLADKARKQREGLEAASSGGFLDAEDVIGQAPPPSGIEDLQRVNETYKGTPQNIADDPVSLEASLDMRRDAQKEAALSFGARGGLAKRNYQVMESMRGFDVVLDKVFDFRSLLIRAPSGLLIEPPIIKESVDALVITEGGAEAAVADKVFDINKRAKIVSAPRNWRQYLIQTWQEVPPPPRVLWPRDKKEQAEWSGWVAQGWTAGIDQAERIFESNINRLVADYNGMVRYRMLLAQGMISAPYAMHEDRGVTGNKNQMRVGDRAVRITGPSQFLTGAGLWKPADR